MKILLSALALLPMMLTNPGADAPKNSTSKSSTSTSVSRHGMPVEWSTPLKRVVNDVLTPGTDPYGPGYFYNATYGNVLICTSNNGLYTLVMQQDGNLVLYKGGTTALWSTNTDGISNVREARFKADGTITVCIVQSVSPWWESGYPLYLGTPFHWILQDDGNFVRYSGTSNWAVSTGTQGGKKSRNPGRIE